MPNEKCVLCGKETNIDITTHIDSRVGYEEGLGQLCVTCHLKGTNREQMIIPTYLINLYPNNQELGSKVRQMFYDLFHKK
jgi:hypothetical protein